jgi:iron-sulfur cluster assembly protein
MSLQTARSSLITLTDAAAVRLSALYADGGGPLRVSLRARGCAGLSYEMTRETAPRPGDEVVVDRGQTVLLDPKAVLFLAGSVLDWEEGLMGASFRFSNPNETGRCGCGESVSLSPSCTTV